MREYLEQKCYREYPYSSEYRAKIEDNQPFPIQVLVGNPGLDLEEDREELEAVEDEDVPAELAKSQTEKFKEMISRLLVPICLAVLSKNTPRAA